VEAQSRTGGFLIVVVGAFLTLASFPSAGATEPFGASVTSTVVPDAYQNVVRVAPPDAMNWPHVVVDRTPGSPFEGDLYVIGTKDTLQGNALWTALVVVRSGDGGRTFDAPRLFEAFRGISFSSVVRIVDIATDRYGFLYIAFEGNGILRSIDGGLSWQFLPVFTGFRYVTGLSVDPASGTLYVVATTTTLVGNPPELLVELSNDQGVTWSNASRIVAGGAMYVEEARIAATSGAVVVGYVAPANVSGTWQGAVAAEVSVDRGVTWSPRIVRGSIPREMHSLRMETSPDGVLGFGWRETWDEPIEANVSVRQYGLYASLSSDTGATFSPPVEIVVGASDLYAPEVALAFDNRSRTYAAWSVPPATVNDFGSLYAAVSNATATGFDNASFHVSLQSRDGYLTAQEDLGAGTNGTVYLAWSALNYSDRANFTIDNATSGIFLRSVSGVAEGEMFDESSILVNTTAVVEFRDPIARGKTLRVPWNNSTIVLGELAPNAYEVWIVSGLGDRRAGSLPVQPWGRTVFAVRVEPARTVPPEPFPWFATGAVVAGIILFGAILAGLQYTRINRGNVFQSKLRLLLYEYVKENPGAAFGQIRTTFGLHNGVAAHHLAVLERQGYVRSKSKGRHRWFYPAGDVSLWNDVPLSALQSSILEAVRRAPGIGVRELSRALDRRASSIGDNVKALVREGFLRTERDGRFLRCYPVEGSVAAPSLP